MHVQMRQFLLKSNKMRKRAKRAGRRKQSIFGFNHIDPRIQEEKLEEIKKLFRFPQNDLRKKGVDDHDEISFP